GFAGVCVTSCGERAERARQRCAGLPVDIRVQDYRDMRAADGTFDRVWSIGMFEHVGRENYRRYIRGVGSCLRDGGRLLLHTIGNFKSVIHTDPWIDRYIFPNSMLP